MMTFRKRLAVSFLAILALFAVNLALFRWSNQERQLSVEQLLKAVDRQMLLAHLRRQIEDHRQSVLLLTQLAVTEPLSEDALGALNQEMDSIRQQIEDLADLSEGESYAEVGRFARLFNDLRRSWTDVYRNFGGPNHAMALQEFQTISGPHSLRASEMLEAMSVTEAQAVRSAAQQRGDVAAFTDRWTLGIFGASALLALAVALHLSRSIADGLGELKRGVSAIGKGDLAHRIDVRSQDELGELAAAFNAMTGNLRHAQNELQQTAKQLEARHQEIEKQKQLSDSLLSNILPAEVATELQNKGQVDPKYFEDVSILFLDFVGFTLATEKLAAEELVALLHDYFTTFDQIVERYRLEKLKTIGDAYMCAGGLPVRNPSHPVDIVMAAFEMVNAVEERQRMASTPVRWSVRAGIHIGPVIAGVVGIQKFAFDVWGDTVNHSSRMESSGEPNRINLSGAAYGRVKDFFDCTTRGKVMTKDKREVEMYFARRILPKLIDEPYESPPPAFLRRYRIYFQKDPPAFPRFLTGADMRSRQAS